MSEAAANDARSQRPGPAGPPARIRLVYIAGAGRSGSTLLGQILGSLDGWIHCGEIRTGLRGLISGTACGCGANLSACEFWAQVLDTAFGGHDRSLLEHADALRRRVALNRHSLQWWRAAESSRFRRDAQELAEILTRLLGAVRVISGSRVLVDSSKTPAFLRVLSLAPELDVLPVHLVRHSCAVVHSYGRARVDPLQGEKIPARGGLLHLSRALGWGAKNLLLTSPWTPVRPPLVVRYEDFVKRPDQSLLRLIRAVGVTNSRQLLNGEGQVDVGRQHTLAGNPMRFQSGRIRFDPDERWRTEMRLFDKSVVGLLSWPWLWRYGYLSKTGSAVPD